MKRIPFVSAAVVCMAAIVALTGPPIVQAEGEPATAAPAECSESGGADAIELAAAQAEKADDCIPRTKCCKVCTKTTACGNTCTNSAYQCRKPRGCACNAKEVCR